MLRLEFDELEELGFDLELTGFSTAEIDLLADVFAEMPQLNSDDRAPYQQMAFMVHDDQKLVIDDAITKAKTNPCYDTGINENSNANALAYICEVFINGNG
jgi:hypothetical protein